jgi:hypothetical protein
MVKTLKYAQTGNSIDTTFEEPNAVSGGKFHLKKAMKKAHVGRKALHTVNTIRKNPIVQDVVADGIGTAVGVETGDPLAAAAAASGTKQLMGSGFFGKHSLDKVIHDEVSKHVKVGGKKLNLKKIIHHPITKKVAHHIHKEASPIIRQAVKDFVEDSMNSSGSTTGSGLKKSKSVSTTAKPKRVNARAQQVKKLMREKGISMIEASKLLKKMNS